jgi:quercetin dioxygenase-like cupin family protein
MLKNPVRGLAAAAVIASAVLLPPASHAAAAQNAAAQTPAVTRTVLLQHDLPIPGYSMVLVAVEIPVGGREGRHTHPGPLIVYVQEGALTLDYEGQPTKTYKAGDTFFVESGKVHEGINNGTVAIKALASFVTPKGAPLTAQVP